MNDAFAKLDAEFPNAPKVLVTGLAEGADILAAEVAVVRSTWRVVGLLPMPLETYEATMTDDAARQRLRAFLELPRVNQRPLLPLHLKHTPEVIAGLSKSSLHYEQLALWLLEHCDVLMVVLPSDEQADRLGGTARVLLHAGAGKPDSSARAVIAASAELALHPVLEPPNPRPVWRIDLTSRPHHGRLHSVIVLPDGKTVAPLGLAGQFPPTREIDLYNFRAGTDAKADWPASRPDCATLLELYRTALSTVQRSYQVLWKRCIWGLGGAFVLAVMLLEAFAKLGHGFPRANDIYLDRWAMPVYVIILIFAVGLHSVATTRRWQATHEDYRAVNEVLRVQRMWWQAGLTGPTHRADYYYLSGSGPPFANIRNWAASFVTWSRIVASQPAEDWSAIQGGPRGYLAGQRRYFHQRSIERERRMFRVSVTSWFCFVLSFGLALWLALHCVQSEWLDRMTRLVGDWSGSTSVHLARMARIVGEPPGDRMVVLGAIIHRLHLRWAAHRLRFRREAAVADGGSEANHCAGPAAWLCRPVIPAIRYGRTIHIGPA